VKGGRVCHPPCRGGFKLERTTDDKTPSEKLLVGNVGNDEWRKEKRKKKTRRVLQTSTKTRKLIRLIRKGVFGGRIGRKKEGWGPR